MSPNTTTIVLEVLLILGAVLVAQYVAGRLHAILAPEEATNLKLEFAVIGAVLLWLLLQGLIAIALDLPEAPAFKVAGTELLNPSPPPPA